MAPPPFFFLVFTLTPCFPFQTTITTNDTMRLLREYTVSLLCCFEFAFKCVLGFKGEDAPQPEQAVNAHNRASFCKVHTLKTLSLVHSLCIVQPFYTLIFLMWHHHGKQQAITLLSYGSFTLAARSPLNTAVRVLRRNISTEHFSCHCCLCVFVVALAKTSALLVHSHHCVVCALCLISLKTLARASDHSCGYVFISACSMLMCDLTHLTVPSLLSLLLCFSSTHVYLHLCGSSKHHGMTEE